MRRGLISKNAFKKLSSGHPWLTATDILDRSELPARAAAVQFGDNWWLHSPASYLRLRRLGPSQAGWMRTSRFNVITNADQFRAYFGDWLLQHFIQTLTRKIELLKLPTDELILRWLFSENDLIPGLIVDVFGDNLIAQINSAPIELFWVQVRPILLEAFTTAMGREARIFERRNSEVRTKEGLEVIEPEDFPPPSVLKWNGLLWRFNPGGKQKTGAYFDQRENHVFTADLARQQGFKSAWDLCCHEGGFGLHLAKAGLSVHAVDQSADALLTAQENSALNSIRRDLFVTSQADVFSWLAEQIEKRTSPPDLIVLDPPSFVKGRSAINSALKGYRELNSMALKTLAAGGVLVSCTCSHHTTPKLYQKVLEDAARDAGVEISILEHRGPSPDHEPVAGFPEGHYLQAWYIRKAPKDEARVESATRI